LFDVKTGIPDMLNTLIYSGSVFKPDNLTYSEAGFGNSLIVFLK
jgi:hypothetical protein